MYITAVRLYCFRSYTELRFEPAKGLNVIVGANAAGKTNILESVFLAALGRSHRTRRDAELINSLSDKAYAGIELVSATGSTALNSSCFPAHRNRFLSMGSASDAWASLWAF